MKKIILLFLISLPIFNYGQSSKEILDFKIGYAPQTSYKQVVEQSSDTELYYIASDEILEKLKNNGVENPTLTKSLTLIESVFKTGKIQKDGNFPVVIEFLKTTNSENKSIIPNGTLIYGKASVSTMPKLDSVVSKEMDESFKKNLLQTVQSMFSQIALPEKKMKIGESFTQVTPLNIPLAGNSIDMEITTIYKLINMTDQIANFDIDQKYVAKIAFEEGKFNINANGNGNGKLVYDIPYHFATKFVLDIGLNFEVKQDLFSLKLKSNSGFNQAVQIIKN
ncbi:hypothetical protein SAMN05444397_101123 [Flavobacterium aquidurense]|uniref:Uncharacterized protein n=1 Tax=Flavobacterium frigidimaris TaxID=262320 RepID=A0ABX4BL94_FLAFR|nr:hypothetical protein [Flavobacterium frigidimaris]OXA76637.1 hypothetical protein B0A65_18450 [Flavobacterium frigidimaris]SDY23774.1 hypothetical protein SAMN05444397_101123 [Flavobacterium aquidurense]